MHGCFCLYVGSSCLPPLSSREQATPARRFAAGLGNRFRPATQSHKCWLGYRSPSGDCARLGFPISMVQAHLLLMCGAVLCLCPAGSWVPPPFQRNGAPCGLWVGWLQISAQVYFLSRWASGFPCLRVSLFTVRGFFLLGRTSVEVIGSWYSGLWFLRNFYP